MSSIKKLMYYLLAFIVPFFLCLGILYFKGILQNVEYIYVSDLRLQHFSFLNYFKNILTGEVSLFYSFNAGMGSSMLSTIIFYCLSPLNLLLLAIKDSQYAILFIYIFKISLTGLTMFTLLKSKMNQNSFVTVLFSTCYALSAFVINYFFSVFWFDSLYLAPLVMLGIDKIFKYGKINLLYIFSLALAIICNIQMGFGLCIYSVIYYGYLFNSNYNIKLDFKKFKQLSIIFVISSLCAGAISSGALLGFVMDFANISSARGVNITTAAGVSNLGLMLKNFFTVGNLKTDYFNNYEPFIYCGLLVSFFSILFLFNTNIDKKKRISAFFVILVFVVSFSINFINLFWHLSSPVLLNFRYSIYLGLFLTTLAYECYISKKVLLKNDIIIMIISLFVGFFMILAYTNEVYVIWTFTFLVLIFGLIFLSKNRSKKFEVLLYLAVIAEIFVNGYLSIYRANDLSFNKYTSFKDLEKIGSWNDFDRSYRVMYNYSYTDFTNDSLLLNKNSSTRYFSSVINGDVIKFFSNNLSAAGNNNYMLSAYDSPLLVSLLGNKYLYLTEELNNSIYTKVESYKVKSYDYIMKKNDVKDIYLYENPYALSLGFVVENDVVYEKNMDLIDYQNKIIKSFINSEKDVLIRLDYTTSSDDEICLNSTYNSCRTYEIINNTGNVLVYVYALYDEYAISDNTKVYVDVRKPLILSTINKKIDLALQYSGVMVEDDFAVMTYDKTNLIESLSLLQKNMLSDIKIDKNILTGNLNSDKSGILFLSIPYDDKFKIYVDGKETKYYSMLNNAYIGLDIEEGEHDIKIEYVEKKFKLYVLSSLIAIVITFCLYYFVNKFISRKQKEEEEKIKQEQLKIEKRKNKAKRKKK